MKLRELLAEKNDMKTAMFLLCHADALAELVESARKVNVAINDFYDINDIEESNDAITAALNKLGDL
jgi:hypothetical protein